MAKKPKTVLEIFEDAHNRLLSRMRNTTDILDKKAFDYGTENFKMAAKIMNAITGKKYRPFEIALVLICIKFVRYGNLTEKDKTPKNEGVEDTVVDLINYIGLMEREREREIKEKDLL